jgi:hypothetical protein
VIGRSENVLTETVDILRADGQTAGATNDFDNVLALFDPASLNKVVFGGMVPPGTKETLRTRLRTANPNIDFVQGLAGIPGLIAAQVQAALTRTADDTSSVTYDPDERALKITLESPQAVRVTGFWATALVPPEPKSTSEIIFNETLQPGSHTVPLPEAFPTAASFVVVHVGTDVHPVTIGPMPRMDILPPPA